VLAIKNEHYTAGEPCYCRCDLVYSEDEIPWIDLYVASRSNIPEKSVIDLLAIKNCAI